MDRSWPWQTHSASRKKRAFFPGAALLLLIAALFLGGCGFLSQDSPGAPTPSATIPPKTSNLNGGGSFGGQGGDSVGTNPNVATGGGFGGPGGDTVGTAPGQATTGAAQPSGDINSVPLAAQATPLPTVQPFTPGSVAFTVPAAKLGVAGRLVYVGGDDKIWTMTADGQDPQVLIDQPTGSDPPGERVVNLNLSPSGKRLMYSVLRTDQAARVYMLDLTNGNVSRQKYAATWAPDSTRLVTSANGSIIVYNADTAQEENIGSGAAPGWTADKKILAYRDGNVWLLDYPANPGADKKLTQFPADGDDSWQFFNQPLYHYSGAVLFAGVQKKSQDAMGNGAKIMSVAANGNLLTLAGPGGSNVRYALLSPSGTKVAYSEQTTRSNCVSYSTVSFVNASGGTEQQVNIPQDDTNFAFVRGITWSPDQKIVYSYAELSCVSGAAVTKSQDKLFWVDPANPANPRYIGDGAFPVFIRVAALGQQPPGQTALASILNRAFSIR